MNSDKSKTLASPAGVTRRDMLQATSALGVAGAALLPGRAAASEALAPVDPQLAGKIRASCIFEVDDESLDERRIQAMRGLLETNLKQIELLRQFDPDEEEPVTRFRPW